MDRATLAINTSKFKHQAQVSESCRISLPFPTNREVTHRKHIVLRVKTQCSYRRQTVDCPGIRATNTADSHVLANVATKNVSNDMP
jgi:hypothetical protein